MHVDELTFIFILIVIVIVVIIVKHDLSSPSKHVRSPSFQGKRRLSRLESDTNQGEFQAASFNMLHTNTIPNDMKFTNCWIYVQYESNFLAAKRSSTRALVLCLSVRPSVRHQVEFLTVWSLFDSLWQLMTAYDSLQQLMTAYDSWWQLITAENSWWQLLTTFDNFWQLLRAFESFWQLLKAYDTSSWGS